MTFAIVAQLLGRRVGGRDEAGDRVGRRRQEQHSAVGVAELVEVVLEAGHDADIAAAAADRPEEVGLRARVDAAELAVGRDDVRGDDRVDREAVLPGQVADPAAGRDPADPDGAGVAEPDGQAVGVGGGRDVGRGRAGLSPGRPRGRVDVDLLHLAEVDHQSAVGRRVAGAAVAAAPDGELEAGFAGDVDDRGDVLRVRDPDDGRWVEIVVVVEDPAGLVVALVVGRDDATRDAVAKVLEGQLGGGHRHGFDSFRLGVVWVSRPVSEPELIARHRRGTGPRRQDRRGSGHPPSGLRSAADTRKLRVVRPLPSVGLPVYSIRVDIDARLEAGPDDS